MSKIINERLRELYEADQLLGTTITGWEIKSIAAELLASRKQIEANKALFEICANAIIQHYQALEDDLPAKAESFLQELLKALYIYCPKESADGTFSELAREMRLHIFTFKD